MMEIHELADGLTRSGQFSVTADDGLRLVRNLETESEYIVEEFDGSFQVRQAICFDCLEMSPEDLSSVHALCSMMNERFSGCKIFIDRWGTLVTASDILSSVASIEFVGTILGQTEFMSQAALELVETIRGQGAIVTQDDVDSALAAPSLQ